MTSKKNLLKELGWPNELIQHFMIDDSEYTDDPSSEYPAEAHS